MNSDIREQLKNMIVVIPSLNPDEKLVRTVEGMLNAGFSQVLLVNDGSDAEHMAPFESCLTHPEVSLVHHEVNRGKGRALKTAFSYVLENFGNAAGVVTADGDGQHTPEDTAAVALKLLERKDKVIMGCRNFNLPGIPFHNRAGNKITSAVFALFCGIKLSDTQTGLRGFPYRYLEEFTHIEGERFEYESNMLLYMGKCSIPFEEVSIRTLYLEGNKSSHFHVIRDSYRIYRPILIYMLSSSISTVVDVVMFTVLSLMFSGLPVAQNMFIATAGARIISSIINYYMNSHAVFKSRTRVSTSLPRYYILCLCQMICAFLGVTLLVTLLSAKGLLRTVIKIIVDCILFVVSFRIQHQWVFNEKTEKR